MKKISLSTFLIIVFVNSINCRTSKKNWKFFKEILFNNLRQYSTVAFLLLLSNLAVAQKAKRQIEIEPYLRWDKYPQFTNRINSIAVYDLQLKGNSYGINGSYKIHFKDNWWVKIGAGYYRYSFNKITSKHRTFGEGHRRVIDYPTNLGITLGTDRYWYNTVNLVLGLEKQFRVRRDIQILTGITFNNYFSFSQYYHLPYDNSFIPQPELQIKNDYMTNDKRYFGVSSELHLGIQKRIKKIAIGPSLIIPIFDSWRQDNGFPTEINSQSRQKWFTGIGVGFSINYTLIK